MTYEAHPLAALFPMMSQQELQEMAANIKANGLIDPIVLYDGKILDGRNRYQACLIAGVEPRLDAYNGAEPIQFVVSKNIHRRHLTPIQLAVLANTIANMNRGGDKRSKKYQSAPVPNDKISQKEAAEMTGASDRTMRLIKSIKENDPQLYEMVVAGKISAKKATEIIQTREVKRVFDAKNNKIKQEKFEQAAAKEFAEKVNFEAVTNNESKPSNKSEPDSESDMSMTIEIAERYIANAALGVGLPENTSFIRYDVDSYRDILEKHGKYKEGMTEVYYATADIIMHYIRGFLAAKRHTEESLQSLLTAELFDKFRRESNGKIQFAEEYHPTWGLPKIPLRQAEYNKLLHCLHPDRVAHMNDAQMSEMFREAFDIVRKLKLTISKPEDFRRLPKTTRVPTLEEFIAQKKAEKAAKSQKAAQARKKNHDATASSPPA
jgi:hypothetical protein